MDLVHFHHVKKKKKENSKTTLLPNPQGHFKSMHEVIYLNTLQEQISAVVLHANELCSQNTPLPFLEASKLSKTLILWMS